MMWCANCRKQVAAQYILCPDCGDEPIKVNHTPSEPEPVNAGLLRIVRDYRAAIADALQAGEIEHAAAHATLNSARCEELAKAAFELKTRIEEIDAVLSLIK